MIKVKYVYILILLQNVFAQQLSIKDQVMKNMVYVRGGTFLMGSKAGRDFEKPVHKVRVDGFYISKYEVTFDEYDAFCETTEWLKPYDEGWGRGNRPVMNISREDMLAYCEWVGGRLPTEAEWEFAAQGGRKSNNYKYCGGNNANEVAWYSINSYKKGQNHPDYGSHPVNTKKPNELGLYHMCGNVAEMCSDWFVDDYYSKSPLLNPKGGLSGRYCILLGGSWFDNPHLILPHVRVRVFPTYKNYDIGFRVVMDK